MPPFSLEPAFDRLKQALKTRGLSYRQLAERLGVSEPTVKRLFIDQDCKLSRLAEICAVLDIALSDILDDANPSAPVPTPLPVQAERLLAQNETLFYLLILLVFLSFDSPPPPSPPHNSDGK